MMVLSNSSEREILIVDDEQANLDALSRILEREGFKVVTASSGAAGIKAFKEGSGSVVITDLLMPEVDGFTVLQEVKKIDSEIEVIVVTAHGTIEKAVHAMRQGAYDFIAKPFDRLSIIKQINKAFEKQELLRENKHLREELASMRASHQIIGDSQKMQEVLHKIDQAAASDATVLILGESGTGKELVANALVQASNRSNKPFVKVSCTTLPESLLEAELFGYEKGAFTGALARRHGRYEAADQGSLFLDEIGDLPLSIQGKLLRVLQEGTFERLGSNKTISTNVRVISATNRDLRADVGAGRFREDLYYRLNVVQLTLPPLRERRDDIPLLINHFLKVFCHLSGKPLTKISTDALKELMSRDWPGNVRQLKNCIERALVFSKSRELTIEDIASESEDSVKSTDLDPPASSTSLTISIGTTMEAIQQQVIAKALKLADGDKKQVADWLGIAERTIYRKLAKRQNPTKEPD